MTPQHPHPRRRVVVTGLGWVTSLGLSVPQVWQDLISGKSGITAITKLVESAKSLAKQARQTSQPSATYNQTITGGNIPADNPASSAAIGTAKFTTALSGVTNSSKSSMVPTPFFSQS